MSSQRWQTWEVFLNHWSTNIGSLVVCLPCRYDISCCMLPFSLVPSIPFSTRPLYYFPLFWFVMTLGLPESNSLVRTQKNGYQDRCISRICMFLSSVWIDSSKNCWKGWHFPLYFHLAHQENFLKVVKLTMDWISPWTDIRNAKFMIIILLLGHSISGLIERIQQ